MTPVEIFLHFFRVIFELSAIMRLAKYSDNIFALCLVIKIIFIAFAINAFVFY